MSKNRHMWRGAGGQVQCDEGVTRGEGLKLSNLPRRIFGWPLCFWYRQLGWLCLKGWLCLNLGGLFHIPTNATKMFRTLQNRNQMMKRTYRHPAKYVFKLLLIEQKNVLVWKKYKIFSFFMGFKNYTVEVC